MKNSKSAMLATACLFGLAALPAAAQAQEEGASDAGTGDIIVTASRREERMQDVGIAVSALSGDQLQTMGVASGKDLARAVPGVNFTAPTGGSGTIVFNLRGVGLNDFGVGNEGPVAIYVDDVYNASLNSAAAPIFDIERVEVLRGPQGTLFGRNATGGLVHFISNRPKHEWGGSIDLRAGDTSFYGEGALNMPIADRLSARIAVVTEQAESFIDNHDGPDGSGINKLAGRFRLAYDGPVVRADLILRAGRGKSRPQYTFEATGTGAHGQGVPIDTPAHQIFGVPNTPSLATLDDNDPHSGAVNTPGRDRRENIGGTLRLEVALADGIDLVSITDVTRNETEFLEDTDVTPLQLVEIASDSQTRQFSQELRLAGTGDSVNWVLGGYYFHNRVRNDRDFNLYLLDTALRSDFSLKAESVAFFGEAAVKVAPTLTLVGGLRWTREVRHVDFAQDLFADIDGSGLYSPTNYVARVFEFNRTVNGDAARQATSRISGRARVEWRPGDGVLAYAAYNRGFKSGGFNNLLDASNVTPAQMPYKPETLDSYDIGIKTETADRRLRFNVNAFYYDYQDFQAFRSQGLSSFLSNVQAEIYGVDVDFNLRPVRGLTLSGGFELLHAKAFDIDLPDGSQADRRLANAPRFSLVAGMHYEAPLGSGVVSLDFNGRHASSQYFNIANSPVTRERANFLVDARIAYQVGNDGPEFYVSAVNLFDRRYRLYAVDVNSLGFTQSMYAEPRRVAVGVKAQF